MSQEMNETKTKNSTLFSKTFIVLTALLLCINGTLSILMMRRSVNAITTQVRGRMLDISKTAAALLDGDVIANIQATDADTEEYKKAEKILRTYQEQMNLEYIYAIRPMEDGTFTFTIDPDPVDAGEFGSSVVSTEALQKANLGIPSVDEESYQDQWGRFYSAYSPIFASDGTVAGIVGVDFNAEWYDSQIRYFIWIIILICLLSLLGGAGIVFLFTTNLRKRFTVLNMETEKMTGELEELADELSLKSGLRQHFKKPSKKAGDGMAELLARLKFVRQEIREYINSAHKMAYTDALTGLGNRNAYINAEHNMDARIHSGNADFSIAIFDINGLKNANDDMGHDCGDSMIVATAQILSSTFGDSRVYRIGGDEFVAIMEGTDRTDAERMLVEVSEKASKHTLCTNGKEVSLAISKGLSEYRKETDSMTKDVFRRADNAMYEDKANYYEKHADRRRKRGAENKSEQNS